jgi:predicted kinase
MKQRFIFMTFGYVGSGKSYVSRWLAPRIHAVHLSVDALRLEMFGEDRPELYTPANKALVNNALQYAAARILAADVAHVVQDANHNQRHVRQKIERIAKEYGAVPIVLWVKTPEETAKQRIQSRAETEGHVIFDPNIIETMRKNTDLPTSDELVITLNGLHSTEKQQKEFDEQFAALQQRLA